MGQLTNLKRLWLDHNQLQELPEGLFGSLSNLQVGPGCTGRRRKGAS